MLDSAGTVLYVGKARNLKKRVASYFTQSTQSPKTKRCSAPCVGLIDEASYQKDVQHAVLFLEGKSQAVIVALVDKMGNAAAQAQEYEKAAKYCPRFGNAAAAYGMF